MCETLLHVLIKKLVLGLERVEVQLWFSLLDIYLLLLLFYLQKKMSETSKWNEKQNQK